MIPADPLDYSLLGISWNNEIYIDKAIGFGLRTGSMICQHIECYWLYNGGGRGTVRYVNDRVVVERDDTTAFEAYTNLRYVISCFSLLEALDKLCPPSTRLDFIGVTFDTVTITINIPANKITEIIAPGKVGHVLLNISYSPCLENCTCRNVWSQLALCLHNAWHVTLSPDRGHVALDADFQCYLKWFAIFLPTYNGRSMMQNVGLGTRDLIWIGCLP